MQWEQLPLLLDWYLPKIYDKSTTLMTQPHRANLKIKFIIPRITGGEIKLYAHGTETTYKRRWMKYCL